MKRECNFPPFMGYVVFKDPIPYVDVVRYEEAMKDCQMQFCPKAVPLVLAYRDALEKAMQANEKNKKTLEAEAKQAGDALNEHTMTCCLQTEKPHCVAKKDDAQAQIVMLPAIFDCVEEWHIKGVSEKPLLEDFPGTPKAAVSKMVAWLLDCITEIIVGPQISESADPNASKPAPSPG